MLVKEPLCIVDGIWDYLGDSVDGVSYFEDLEILAQEERAGLIRDRVRLNTEIIKNCMDCILPIIGLQSDWRVLDVGCGNGYLLSHIAVSDSNKTACDSSWAQLRQFNLTINRMRTNIETLPLLSSSQELVLCTDVVEHVHNDEVLISEIFRVLVPGGYLLFSVPWKQDLRVLKSSEYLKKYGNHPGGHRRSVDESVIKKYFDKRFVLIASTEIDVTKRFMEFKPYSTKLMFLRKIKE